MNKDINKNMHNSKYIKILKVYILILIMLLCFLTVGCTKNEDENLNNKNKDILNYTYNFNDASEGFIINKTDVPLSYSDEDYELKYELEEVPISGDSTKALSIEYINKNKDMFVYVFKEIGEESGVEASTTYDATLNFDIATNIDDESVGKKTYVKAGIVNRLPLPVEKSEIYEFNIDKGNNEQEGKDLKTLEGITKPNINNTNYEYKDFVMNTRVTSSKNGMIYAIVGLDSTYDEKIKFYIDNVNIKLNKVKDEKVQTEENNNVNNGQIVETNINSMSNQENKVSQEQDKNQEKN